MLLKSHLIPVLFFLNVLLPVPIQDPTGHSNGRLIHLMHRNAEYVLFVLLYALLPRDESILVLSDSDFVILPVMLHSFLRELPVLQENLHTILYGGTTFYLPIHKYVLLFHQGSNGNG